MFSLKLLIETRKEFNLETHLAITDYEKVFDRVNRSILWNIMHKRDYHKNVTDIIRGFYYCTGIVLSIGEDFQ